MQPIEYYSNRLVDPKSAELLNQWCLDNFIPNPISPDELHCSVITSLTPIPGYRPDPSPVLIRPNQFRVCFLNEALAIVFDNPILQRAWNRATALCGVLKYPKYVGHVSISYSVPYEFDVSVVKPPTFPIRLLAEETVPLLALVA